MGKPAKDMTNGEINRALDANLKKQLRLNQTLIERGFGHVRSSELRRDHADDADVAKMIILADAAQVLSNEARRRYGPGFTGRLPLRRRKTLRKNPTFKTGKPKTGTRAASTRRGTVKQDVTPSYTIKQTGRHSGVIPNPRGRQYKKAVSLYRDFTGENPRHIDDWDVIVPSVAMEVGKVTGIMYKARVDGQLQEFLHEFTGRSRPILAASADGRQLLLLGGDYKMTERGIVDGTYEFVR